MIRTRLITGSVLALTLTLGVAGCSIGSGGSSSAGSSAGSSAAPTAAAPLSATPATGPSVTGDGYTYSLPKGWKETETSASPTTDTIAVDSKPKGDFANNVNVIVSQSGAAPADQIEQRAADQFTSNGATDAKVRERVTVADVESAHVSAGLSASGATYNIQQYYVPHEKQTYVVTFSFAKTVSDSDAIDIAESVLATWKWS